MTQSRDQDVGFLLSSFRANLGKRHFLVEKFRKDYEALYKRLVGGWSLPSLIIVRGPLRFTVDAREILINCDRCVAAFFSTPMAGSLLISTGRKQKNSSR